MYKKYLKRGLFFFFALSLSFNILAKGFGALPTIVFKDLPPEAQQTLLLIKKGQPLPYPKDGAVFGNREGILPKHKRGYYREYTVKTPGVRNRGARRIVAGGDGWASQYYYTDDHYASFKHIHE